ncbi:hypothetical protein SASK131_17060 [Staphylococcus argenteus]|nr:hypothetical protein TMSFP064_01830 [Staphylococcus argenteus]BCN89808.1 hypothetical protein TMSFP069_01830 [Staphylococcus argenteus]GJF39554.1 hypothetical protein SA19056_17610 [Staphylococcus argenteus]GJF42222.1 hypothetical protein SA19059_18740 [Staphylococcus argenteus]GJF47285.1 hypothetical protein SA19080_18010 [Staphylococcus argenteus]
MNNHVHYQIHFRYPLSKNIIITTNCILKNTKLKQYFTLNKQSSKIMFAGFKLVFRKRVL